MKVLFIVQGEGRGHMTQAITLRQELLHQGHQVLGALVGKSDRRQIPSFFYRHFEGMVFEFQSPNFLTSKKGKGILVGKTISYNLLSMRRYVRSLRWMHRWIVEAQPDMVINFYDLLGGCYHYFYPKARPYIVIGHQYLAEHPEFPYAKGLLGKLFFRLCNHLTSYGSDKQLALSYRPYPDYENDSLKVVPPLLRKEVFDITASKGDFHLAYVVNAGYGFELLEWYKHHATTPIHCFWDNQAYPDGWSPIEGLFFHQLAEAKFLQMLGNCHTYISTAGFESVCEAILLNKPIIMIPVEGQYEQACNALDASIVSGIAYSKNYRLSQALQHLAEVNLPGNDRQQLQTWYRGGAKGVVAILEDVLAKAYATNFSFTLDFTK